MIILLALTSLIISGCFSSHPASDNYMRVAASTSVELKAQLNLHTWGSGVQWKDRKVNVYEATFLYDKHLTISQSRKLALNVAEIIKDKLNDDISIQSYLYEKPIKNKNLLFSIYFFNTEENSEMAVTLVNEVFYYDKIDSTTYKHTLLFKESFVDALEKVNACYSHVL